MNITHDLHTHTLFSSCCYDPEATMYKFIKKASELGHSVFGISNHLWDEKVEGASAWYKGQTVDYNFEAKFAIPANTLDVKVLFGCETEYCGMNNNLGLLAETASRFDYVLVPHTHTHMKNFVVAENADVDSKRNEIIDKIISVMPYLTRDMAVRMTASLKYTEIQALVENVTVDNNKLIADFCFSSFESLLDHPEFEKMAAHTPTFIAHPFWPCGETKDIAKIFGFYDRDRLFSDFKRAADMNVGLDVNISTYKLMNDLDNDNMVSVMRIAREAGCKFIFGTDSHSVKGLDNIRKGDAIADAIGITDNNIADIAKA